MIEKMIDNFMGEEEELRNIALTVFECVDGSNTNDDTFMDECDSMIGCDYGYLNPNQVNEVLDLIEELILNDGNFKEKL